MHLLELLDSLGNYFIYLEQQEGILTEELPSIIFIFVMVHQMVIV